MTKLNYWRYAKIRDARGMKDSDVSLLSAITQSTFVDWKSGRSKPKMEKLVKIARALEVSVGYLIGTEEYFCCKDCEIAYDLLSEDSVKEHDMYHSLIMILKNNISHEMNFDKANDIVSKFCQTEWDERTYEEFSVAYERYLEATYWLEILQLAEERKLKDLKQFLSFDKYRLLAVNSLWKNYLVNEQYALNLMKKYDIKMSNAVFHMRRQQLIRAQESLLNTFKLIEHNPELQEPSVRLHYQGNASEDSMKEGTRRRKVLFTYGMSNDFQLIITDAPVKAIEEWCVQYVTDQENGENFEPFYTLKSRYYVRELLDSETEDSDESMKLIGYDEAYDYGAYDPKQEEEQAKVKYAGTLSDPSVEEMIEFLKKYKGSGLKISVMGISHFNAFVSKDYLIFDEEDLSEEHEPILEENEEEGEIFNV